jgi:hypothetical protein
MKKVTLSWRELSLQICVVKVGNGKNLKYERCDYDLFLLPTLASSYDTLFPLSLSNSVLSMWLWPQTRRRERKSSLPRPFRPICIKKFSVDVPQLISIAHKATTAIYHSARQRRGNEVHPISYFQPPYNAPRPPSPERQSHRVL